VRVALIAVPYSLGREDVEVARGPGRLLDSGAVAALERASHDVEVERVVTAERAPDAEEYWSEAGASFEVVRLVSGRVREAVARGAFPVVLAGNCLNSVGVVAGVGPPDVGVVWFDAHADFNTTGDTTSGFLDGMGLSILTGTGWDALRETVPGYRAVPEATVVLIGMRDPDDEEQRRLDVSEATVVSPPAVGDALGAGLDALRERVGHVYLHLDLDVLDPSEGRVNVYAAEGGLSAEEVSAAITAVGERFVIRAAAITAHDPGCDPEGSIPPTASRLLVQIAEAAAGARALST
jgi:arginase